MKTLAPRLTRSESVIDAMLEGEALVLNVETGVYFGLTGVGARIWDLLADTATEDEIVDALLREYDVEPAQLRRDVTGFIETLVAKGLMRVVDA